MTNARMQYCFYCGEELGVYKHFHGDEPECCGKRECMRELRDILRAEQDERHERAMQDNYSRY